MNHLFNCWQIRSLGFYSVYSQLTVTVLRCVLDPRLSASNDSNWCLVSSFFRPSTQGTNTESSQKGRLSSPLYSKDSAVLTFKVLIEFFKLREALTNFFFFFSSHQYVCEERNTVSLSLHSPTQRARDTYRLIILRDF